MLRIVLFHAWLNLKYPSSATPLAPLIERLREREKRATNAGMPTSYEELHRVAFGPRVPPLTRKNWGPDI